MTHKDSESLSPRFPTTDWCFLAGAPARADADSSAALNDFLRRYWRPIFYFIRARGRAHHHAEDLTQEFLLRFWAGDLLLRADRGKGRFRSFMLAVLRRFLSDQGPRAPLQKRFEWEMVSVAELLDDGERAWEPAAGETPETVFWQKWAAAALERVLERLRHFYEAEGRPEWYRLFAAYHLEGTAGQEVLGERLGLSRDQVVYRLRIVRARFQQYTREEVGAGAEDEAAEILALVQR